MKQLFVISIFVTLASLSIGQRVAPGVPPQHYVSIDLSITVLSSITT